MSGLTLAGGGPSSASASERALKLQTDGPHLVSMGGDRLSTSVTLHPLPQGRVTLGSGSGVDIPVKGTGVAPLHCHIENSEGVVTIYPLSENLSIDGVKVSGPTRLSQGVMLTIGRSNYMRFNHPAEAKLMKSVLPNPRISMAPINFEPPSDVVAYQTGKTNKKPPVVPRKSPRESLSDSGSEDPPSSIMTKVSKFEYLAAQNLKKSFSPKVFSSNVPTVNIPVKDVLGKDIRSLTKNLPQSALNYAELNFNEKQQNKSSNSNPILTRKHQPQYVNVAINDVQKSINNKVVIFENGCITKTPPNVNFDHNDLTNKLSTKNVNVNRATPPSPNFNRNPVRSTESYHYYRSVTPSPVSNSVKPEHRRSGSLSELTDHLAEDLRELTSRKHEAENRRVQAQRDRIREQELEKVEQQRLDEILSMCAEYEKQTSHSPVEKSKPVTPNRIITNGSLPRDKRHLGPPSPSYCSPPQSPLDILHNELLKQSNHQNYGNVTLNYHPARNVQYENVDLRHQDRGIQNRQENGVSSYENVNLGGNSQGSYPPSPRTRIKTFVPSNNRDKSPKESQESLDSKYAILETEKKLLREAEIVLRQNLHNFKEVNVLPQNLDSVDMEPRKSTPTKFIFPMEADSCSNETSENRQSTESRLEDDSSNLTNNSSSSSKEYNLDESERDSEERKKRMEHLKKEKKEILAVISRIKRQMTEVDIQEEELHREIELEKALINGEYKSKQLELEKIESKKQKLSKRAQRIEESMVDCQIKQEEDQQKCKEKLKEAQENMNAVEEKLKNTQKGTQDYEDTFEEYLQAQEQLDNERKNFEDLEFHHLEEEADWLASREELQREIVELSNKIDHIRNHIQDLENQKHNTSKTNSKEYRGIERHKMECMVRLEEIRSRLKYIDHELSSYSNHESERDYSSDSDSDRSKDIDQHLSNKMSDLSVSMIVSNQKVSTENEYNMSQSYNEKLFQEKSVLEGATKRFPSQDDIDRISKVTSDTPIIEERESLGRKTIESLKEIDRIRHLHLCQQGSQVIEQERQRMNDLKQRVQEEVKSQWAQQRQDSPSLILTEVNGHSNSDCSSSNDKTEKRDSAHEDKNLLREESSENSRPMSEISEMSLEVGTLSKKRNKPPSDKQRPLTRYLPIRGSDLDLRQHIESAGHQVVLCPHVIINSNSCRGFLHKRGSKLNGWSRRWFVFDRLKHTLTYYSDKSEKKPRGGAYFQAIEEVYLDHLNNIKSPNPQLTFIIKTHERHYYLMAPSPEAMRIWVDVVFTGAEGYREFEHGT